MKINKKVHCVKSSKKLALTKGNEYLVHFISQEREVTPSGGEVYEFYVSVDNDDNQTIRCYANRFMNILPILP